MSSGDNYTHTIQWGNTGAAGDSYHYNPQENKIYFDEWKNIAPVPDHNHNPPSYFTYNDDSVKMDRIVDVIDEMLAALEPVIDIGSMKKISSKLIKLRNSTNSMWTTYKDFGNNYSKPEPKEQKIKLEEDLFEI